MKEFKQGEKQSQENKMTQINQLKCKMASKLNQKKPHKFERLLYEYTTDTLNRNH